MRRRRGAHRTLRGGQRHAGALEAMVQRQSMGGGRIAAKRGHKRAVVAVARKLAVVMHRMWLDGSEFRFAAADGSENSTGASKTTALAAAC